MTKLSTQKTIAKQIVADFEAKGYTETQVVNALVRREAHLTHHSDDEDLIKVASLAVLEAKARLTKAHSEKFVPCQKECMEATADVCVCHCNGANHGKHGAGKYAGSPA